MAGSPSCVAPSRHKTNGIGDPTATHVKLTLPLGSTSSRWGTRVKWGGTLRTEREKWNIVIYLFHSKWQSYKNFIEKQKISLKSRKKYFHSIHTASLFNTFYFQAKNILGADNSWCKIENSIQYLPPIFKTDLTDLNRKTSIKDIH